MKLGLSDEERMVQETAREFADSEIAPVAANNDAEGRFPADIVKKLAELGFMGMLIPEKYGGAGLGNFCLVLALEEINRVCASTGVTMSVHNSLATSPIIKFGSDYLKETYLPKLATSEMLGAYALSEAEAGSDAASLKCRAVKDGDEYVVNGTKLWVTTGAHADLFIVMLRTDTEKRSKGISAFVVERDTPGFKVGKKENKLGLRGSSTTELIFEDCRLPAKNLIGEEGIGFVIAMATLDGGRIGIGTQAVGIAQACLDASVAYAKEREQFGRKIGEFQAIQWKIADMATAIEASRLMVYRAARMRDMDVPHTKEAAMAKLFASEAANRAAREAVQIHGGAGYLKDFPVERYFRDARITELYEGTSEVQRIVISRSYLQA
ncbi:MAG: acyl-CoA dehydrogenase [Candidatus Latescibacterota bacterium]|nr:MAG: acyl-CoA dehydrogenase [Candidatus Latescibacterota bacterium]